MWRLAVSAKRMTGAMISTAYCGDDSIFRAGLGTSHDAGDADGQRKRVAADERTDLVQRWLDRAGRGIAHALVSAVAVTDSRVAVIDGAFPRSIHGLLIDKIRRHLDLIDVAGIDLPGTRRGSLGLVARALGAVGTMLNRRFLVVMGDEPPTRH